MKTYIIHLLKWAITLTLAYALYHNSQNYSAIALIWVMVWIEMVGYIATKSMVLCDLSIQATAFNTECTRELIDSIQAALKDTEGGDIGG